MELGQALVISMLVVALIGALIVFTSEAIREAQTSITPPSTSEPVRWMNVSSTDATTPDQSWVERIYGAMPEGVVELTNLATPGTTADQLAHLLKSVNQVEAIDIATIWVGPEDLLAGVPLAEFEQSLSLILTCLAAQQAKIIVGNLPNLTPELVNARLALHDIIQPVIEQWNGTIARLTATFGGTLVDFHGDGDQPALRFLSNTRFEPDEDAQDVAARKFAQAMAVTFAP